MIIKEYYSNWGKTEPWWLMLKPILTGYTCTEGLSGPCIFKVDLILFVCPGEINCFPDISRLKAIWKKTLWYMNDEQLIKYFIAYKVFYSKITNIGSLGGHHFPQMHCTRSGSSLCFILYIFRNIRSQGAKQDYF